MPLYQAHHIGPIERTYSVNKMTSSSALRTTRRRKLGLRRTAGGAFGAWLASVDGAEVMAASYRVGSRMLRPKRRDGQVMRQTAGERRNSIMPIRVRPVVSLTTTRWLRKLRVS